ncbi:MAG TPA: hypothetical protein VIK55_12500 [Paludibacter sp.]
MKINSLEISKIEKLNFLNKLKSGNYRVGKLFEPQPGLNFEIEPDGLYKCQQDNRILTSDQIKSLPGYHMIIELVSTRAQVSHQEPAEGFILCPFNSSEYLNSLLIPKN